MMVIGVVGLSVVMGLVEVVGLVEVLVEGLVQELTNVTSRSHRGQIEVKSR